MQATGRFTGEELYNMCGGSPLIWFIFCGCLFVSILVVGEIHRRGEIVTTLVLPSLNRLFWGDSQERRCNSDVGEITQGRRYNKTLSFSPLFFSPIEGFHVGEIHRALVLFNSRSPPYEPKLVTFIMGSILVHFMGTKF